MDRAPTRPNLTGVARNVAVALILWIAAALAVSVIYLHFFEPNTLVHLD